MLSVLCLSICNSKSNLRMVLAEGFTECMITVGDSKGGGKAGKGFVGKEGRSRKIMEKGPCMLNVQWAKWKVFKPLFA